MDVICKYYPKINVRQVDQLKLLQPLYQYWNKKINIISRKDIDELYLRHVLHSLAIDKFLVDQNNGKKMNVQTKFLDVGTGGGFPGIPLAIMYPEINFLLVDSIQKKIDVVKDIVNQLSLSNVRVVRSRAENIVEKFDYVICRAVAKIEKLLNWTAHVYGNNQNNILPNGLIALKGGELTHEIENINHPSLIQNIDVYFEEEFFKTKKIVYVKMK